MARFEAIPAGGAVDPGGIRVAEREGAVGDPDPGVEIEGRGCDHRIVEPERCEVLPLPEQRRSAVLDVAERHHVDVRYTARRFAADALSPLYSRVAEAL